MQIKQRLNNNERLLNLFKSPFYFSEICLYLKEIIYLCSQK
jgi:hypothetical protein